MAEHRGNAAVYQPYSLSSAGSSPQDESRVQRMATSSLNLAKESEGMDILSPLKEALKATTSILEGIQAIDDNQEEWNDLAQCLVQYMTAIENQVAYLEKYPEGERAVDETLSRPLTRYVELLEDFHGKITNHRRRRSRLAFTAMTKVKLDAGVVRKFNHDVEHQHNQFMHSLCLFTGQRVQMIGRSTKASSSDAQIDINSILQLPMVAFVASSVHRTCLPGTRQAILQVISNWAAEDISRTPIFWLCDIAGSGKSTVAMSASEFWQAQRVLGAQFFFSLDSSECSSTEKFWSTIARELVQRMPELAPHIADAVKRNPAIMRSPFHDQLQELVINPLRHRKNRVILVIDAVDECKSEMQRKELMESVIMAVRGSQTLKILITSRPDPIIEATLGPFMTKVKMKDRLHDIEHRDNIDDIANYVHQSLEGVLSPEKRRRLVQKANGLFIWASTACRMLKSTTSWEKPESTYSRLISADQPGDIDDVYALIFERTDPKFYTTMCSTLALLLATFEPLTVGELDDLLRDIGIRGSAEALVRNLGSVITQDPSTNLVYFRHPTFVEYLRRCCIPSAFDNGSNIYIDIAKAHGQLAWWSFKYLKSRTEGLRFNICEIESSFHRNSDIPDLEDRVSKSISRELRYASHHWTFHVARTDDKWKRNLKNELQHISKAPYALYWMEILSFTKALARGIAGLRAVAHCTAIEEETKDRLIDVRRFMMAFSTPICDSTPHIYLSALPFSPIKSMLHIEGLKQFQNTLSVIKGLEEQYRELPEALEGHQGPVLATILSPDNSMIVSSSGDKTIRMWDADTGLPLGEPLRGHERWIRSIAISPDGSRIISGSDDSTIRLWNANTGQLLGEPLRGHELAVNAVAFSPDGSRVASGSSDTTIRLWDAGSGLQLGEPLRGHQAWVNAVAFSPDGTQIISIADNGRMLMWDADSGRLLGELPQAPNTRGITVAVFSPDGSHIACGLGDATIQLWNTCTVQSSGQLFPRGHKDPIKAIAFSPDGSWIVSGDRMGTIRLWNVDTGQMLGEAHRCLGCSITRAVFDGNHAHVQELPFHGHRAIINAIAFSSDGSRVVSGSGDQTIRIWNADNGRALGKPLLGHKSSICALGFSSDGSKIVTSSYGCTVQLWDAHTGQPLGDALRGQPLEDPLREQPLAQQLRERQGRVETLVCLENGTILFPDLSDEATQIRDLYTGEPLGQPLRDHTRWSYLIASSPDGRYIISRSLGNAIRVWDVYTGFPFGVPVPDPERSIKAVAVSKDGSKLALCLGNGTIRLQYVRTGQQLGALLQVPNARMTAVAFSADSSRIVSGSSDRTIRLWDADTGRALGKPIRGHQAWIDAVAFSPDGLRIASSARDHTVRIWDVENDVSSNETSMQWSDSNIISTSPDTPFRISVPGFEECSLSQDGWVQSSGKLLFWVPPDNRHGLKYSHRLTIPTWSCYRATALDLTTFQCGASWTEIRRGVE